MSSWKDKKIILQIRVIVEGGKETSEEIVWHDPNPKVVEGSVMNEINEMLGCNPKKDLEKAKGFAKCWADSYIERVAKVWKEDNERTSV